METNKYFWAKTTADKQPGVSVVDHLIDVGCVAQCMAKCFPLLLKRFGLRFKEIGALAALHDIGKISPGFQRKCNTWLVENGLEEISQKWRWDSEMESDHGKVSHSVLQRFCRTVAYRRDRLSLSLRFSAPIMDASFSLRIAAIGHRVRWLKPQAVLTGRKSAWTPPAACGTISAQTDQD